MNCPHPSDDRAFDPHNRRELVFAPDSEFRAPWSPARQASLIAGHELTALPEDNQGWAAPSHRLLLGTDGIGWHEALPPYDVDIGTQDRWVDEAEKPVRITAFSPRTYRADSLATKDRYRTSRLPTDSR